MIQRGPNSQVRGDKPLTYPMNSILVQAWDAFNVSARNIVRDNFVKTKLLPLSNTNFTTKT